jgi:hypothetical protein
MMRKVPIACIVPCYTRCGRTEIVVTPWSSRVRAMVKHLEWEPATYSRRAVPRSAAWAAPPVAPFGAPLVFLRARNLAKKRPSARSVVKARRGVAHRPGHHCPAASPSKSTTSLSAVGEKSSYHWPIARK